jgi:hypothetical protein
MQNRGVAAALEGRRVPLRWRDATGRCSDGCQLRTRRIDLRTDRPGRPAPGCAGLPRGHRGALGGHGHAHRGRFPRCGPGTGCPTPCASRISPSTRHSSTVSSGWRRLREVAAASSVPPGAIVMPRWALTWSRGLLLSGISTLDAQRRSESRDDRQRPIGNRYAPRIASWWSCSRIAPR